MTTRRYTTGLLFTVAAALAMVHCGAPEDPPLTGLSAFKPDTFDAGTVADDGPAASAGGVDECRPKNTEGKLTRSFAGAWFEHQQVASISDVPLLGVQDTGADAYNLWVISGDGPSYEAHVVACDSIPWPITNNISVIPQALIDSIAPMDLHIETSAFGAGAAFAPDVELQLWGLNAAKMDDPWNDALPESRRDERVKDSDHDKKEGVTIVVNGILAGEIYVVQRLKTLRLGTAIKDDAFRGRITQSIEQNIIRASSKALEQHLDSHQNPDPSKSWFTLVRVNDTCSCKSGLANADKIFSAVE